jgi:nucleoside-diphosphate-sugar epimerase
MIERGHDVHCLVRPAHRPWRLRDIAPAMHTVDLLDVPALDALLGTLEPHWVLHLAAYGAYESQADAARCVRTNVEGTVQLIDAASRHGVERLVNTGSSSEYGAKDHAPDETDALEPNSLYAVTKAAATAYARHAGRSGKLHTTTLRLYSVYGPYEEPTRLIPTLIVRGLSGRYPALVSPGTARDFVYVDDVLSAYEAALLAPIPAGGVYNVGSGVQTSLRTAAEVCRSAFEIAEEPDWESMPPRSWDTATWVANTARTRSELGWQATTSFEDGFVRTARWLTASPERRSFYENARTLPT